MRKRNAKPNFNWFDYFLAERGGDVFGYKWFDYVLAERDKINAHLRLIMDENEIFKKLMAEDPLFKKIAERIAKADKFVSASNEEQNKQMHLYFSNLFWVVSASVSLSEAIDLMTLACIRFINSPRLFKRFNNDRSLETSPITKLQFLRFADIITEDTYNDLYKIYDIRNEFAHKPQSIIDTKEVFGRMKDLTAIDDKLKQMHNDCGKYALVTVFYRDKLLQDTQRYAKLKNWKPPV